MKPSLVSGNSCHLKMGSAKIAIIIISLAVFAVLAGFFMSKKAGGKLQSATTPCANPVTSKTQCDALLKSVGWMSDEAGGPCDPANPTNTSCPGFVSDCNSAAMSGCLVGKGAGAQAAGGWKQQAPYYCEATAANPASGNPAGYYRVCPA
jgi:hypothetical protein